MAILQWDRFLTLEGGPRGNFERLCGGIVRSKFRGYGNFRQLLNQPGVEFHLEITQKNKILGDIGRWWGWQCKWFERKADNGLRTGQRDQIKDSISKTLTHVSEITDWVLWTPHVLIRKDQEWFYGLHEELNLPFRLHLWTEEDIAAYTIGDASVLREAYFGELILTSERLRNLYNKSIAPISDRWTPEVHSRGREESEIRKALGEVDEWAKLDENIQNIIKYRDLMGKEDVEKRWLDTIITNVNEILGVTQQILHTLEEGRFDLLQDILQNRTVRVEQNAVKTSRILRVVRSKAGLYAYNLIVYCSNALRLCDELNEAISTRIVAVAAPAGCGKTQLACELTNERNTLPHGLLFHGRDLKARGSLDDFAKTITLGAKYVPTIGVLFEAVNSFGQRIGYRVPIVIDGLNEAEDPRRWHSLLAEADVILKEYPYVLLVVTLRPDFVEEALNQDINVLNFDEFKQDFNEVAFKYLEHWKINAPDEELPSLLRHPFTLRMFCESVNPTRQNQKSVSFSLNSITDIFEKHLNTIKCRIEELAPPNNRISKQDVETALNSIAEYLWLNNVRWIERETLRKRLNDQGRSWNHSIVRALEQEGLLFSVIQNRAHGYIVAHDLLAGHIIAASLTYGKGQKDFEQWLDEKVISRLFGPPAETHTFQTDILQALVERIPRDYPGSQLWKLLPMHLQIKVLIQTAALEPKYLDRTTVEKICSLVENGEYGLFHQFKNVRDNRDHPLNADTLDSLLRKMTVATRDLLWTEWLRENLNHRYTPLKEIYGYGFDYSALNDVQPLLQRWKDRRTYEGDELRARWLMWVLASTVHELRDNATQALYWFGRMEPKKLFALTIDSIGLNDPYVTERMFSAAYGVVMAHQDKKETFKPVLKEFLAELVPKVVGIDAEHYTPHYGTRKHIRGIIDFSKNLYADIVPIKLMNNWSFKSESVSVSVEDATQFDDEISYEIRWGIEDADIRSLYDWGLSEEAFVLERRHVESQVAEVIKRLGWEQSTFRTVDLDIRKQAGFRGYGKYYHIDTYLTKYRKIGYERYIVYLDDKEDHSFKWDGFYTPDLDPSFPARPPVVNQIDLTNNDWLFETNKDDQDWVKPASVSLPLGMLRREEINGESGPWIAVRGSAIASRSTLGRRVHLEISLLIDVNTNIKAISSHAEKQDISLWKYHDTPTKYYIYANEIPWHPAYADLCDYEQEISAMKELKPLCMAYRYSWESRGRAKEHVTDVYVPSPQISKELSLYTVAQSFAHFCPDGTRGSITLSEIEGVEGNILYLREDMLSQYMLENDATWLVSSEKFLTNTNEPPPEWLVSLRKERKLEWHETIPFEKVQKRKI